MTSDLAEHPVVKAICSADQVSTVLDVMYDSCVEMGADKFNYHFTPIFDRQNSHRADVFSAGFPRTWVALYGNRIVRSADPIPETVMREGRVMSWGEAVDEADLSEAEKIFIAATKRLGLINGIGVPLWGHASRNAYAAMGFPSPIEVEGNCEIQAQQMLLQAGHQRICELLPNEAKAVNLSKRETEILTWVAQGKSNRDIGTILDISSETVATYMARIYDKIGSRDRVGAVIRGLKLGLIAI